MKRTRSATPTPYHHGDLRRALIDAALAMVTEEQAWTFSLREVARRAGVSHNAPYNHFSEKIHLLDAVAAVGFERLREQLVAAIDKIDAAEEAFIASGRAYIRFGLKNPALYRLMFGPDLAAVSVPGTISLVRQAGAQARAVLQDIIARGARSGEFAISPDDRQGVALTTLATWSAAHGLTMLVIDNIAGPLASVQDMIERVVRLPLDGLLPRPDQPSAPTTPRRGPAKRTARR